MRRAFFLVWLAALPASAQLVPSGVEHVLSRDASRQARFVSSPDGRIARAWSLAIRVPGASAEDRARTFLARYVGELAIAPGAALRFDRAIDAHGVTNARFVRTAHGGDTIGSSIVVGERAGVIEYVLVSRVDALPIRGARAIDRDTAIRIAGDRTLDAVSAAYPIDGVLIPVFRVDTAGVYLHQRDRVIVDARDGRVLARGSRMFDALGRVYERNPITDDGVTAEVDLRFLTSREFLTGRYFRAANCNASDRGCQIAQLAVADATTGDFLYDPVEPSFNDAFAEVHAYYHANRVAEYFRTVHGFTWTCGGDPLMRLFVNYTEAPNMPYGNAMYAPSASTECGYMLFGQGEDRDFAYDADVVYHENTHSIVDEVAGLEGFLESETGVSFEPGALNEGFADYFAASFSGDAVIGEYFMGDEGAEDTGLRSVDNTFSCPNDLVGEVHYDGRIWGGLGWDLREALGAEKADVLMFATLAALGEAPTLAEAGDAAIAAASALASEGTLSSDEAMRAQEAVTARGLPGCERVAPLDAPRTGYAGVPGITSQAGGLAPIQYRIDIPANARSLTLSIESTGRVTGDYRFHARWDRPVTFSAMRGTESDFEPSPGVAIEREELPRCGVLYLAVVQTDLDEVGPSLFTIEADLETTGIDESCPMPDAGVIAMDDAGRVEDGGPDAGADAGTVAPSGGCGCRSTRTRPPLAIALFVAAALVWSSVRRRRP